MIAATTPNLVRAERAAAAQQRALLARSMLAECAFAPTLAGRTVWPASPAPAAPGPKRISFPRRSRCRTNSNWFHVCRGLERMRFAVRFLHHRGAKLESAPGPRFVAGEMAERAVAALADGARTVMILGGEPTIHCPPRWNSCHFCPRRRG